MNHLLSVLNLTKNQILNLINKAEIFKNENKNYNYLKNKTLVNIFYEPSTRTSCSFQAAMIKLGGNTINITDKYSSVEKGESLTDTIKTAACYGDIIVLRHPIKGSAHVASNVSSIPVINAGDGNNEHPTQALLDIFTIKTELIKYNIDILDTKREKKDKIVITFMGDLKNSRTIHSLIHILCLFPVFRFIFVNPCNLEMPEEITQKLIELNIDFVTNNNIKEVIQITDVLYVTRIQKERFKNIHEYDAIVNSNTNNFIVKKSLLQYAKENMIIMHPLPRLNEIDEEIDNDKRAVYFEQVKNGIYMRMAILDSLLQKS
jgi:carbamoyl-phosphate synthase/aspartate carbamoyltransferase